MSSVMYFTDSYSHRIWAFDFDLDAGTFENKRVFAEIPEDEGVPDGATVDAEGFVWCAHMFGAKVSRLAPDGSVERTIALPVPQVTSCAFERARPRDALHHHRLAPHGPRGAQPAAARGRAVRGRPGRARPARAGVRRLSPRRGMTGDRAPSTSWLAVAAIAVAGIVAAFQIGKLPAALPVLRAELGLSLVEAGWIVSALAAVGVATGMVWGFVADRFGHRRMLLSGLGVVVLGTALGSFAGTGTELFLTRLVEGCGYVTVLTAGAHGDRRLLPRARPADGARPLGVLHAGRPRRHGGDLARHDRGGVVARALAAQRRPRPRRHRARAPGPRGARAARGRRRGAAARRGWEPPSGRP